MFKISKEIVMMEIFYYNKLKCRFTLSHEHTQENFYKNMAGQTSKVKV